MEFSKDAITAAAFVFEATNGNMLGDWEKSEIEKHHLIGIDSFVLSLELVALIESAKSSTSERQTAYWALGKRHDESLISFFRKQLSIELKRDLLAVYQILIALDTFGEPVFKSELLSESGNDLECHRRFAEQYLITLS